MLCVLHNIIKNKEHEIMGYNIRFSAVRVIRTWNFALLSLAACGRC